MPTVADWQATYALLKQKYDEAVVAMAPKVTLPGGVVVDKQTYLDDLLSQMERIGKMVPGAAPEQKPIFTHTSVAR